MAGVPKPIRKVGMLLVEILGTLVVLYLLGQMARMLPFRIQSDEIDDFPSSDYETKIAEMTEYLKITTEKMQFRFEAIQKEMKDLKTELSNKIDNNFFETFSRLERLGDGIEREEQLCRDEFQRLKEEIKNMTIHERRAFAWETIEKETQKPAADGIERKIEKPAAYGICEVDYAAATEGGTVVDHSDPFFGKLSWFNKKKVDSYAVKMLMPSSGEPGGCFHLKGSIGFVELRLSSAIYADSFTIEHINKGVAIDRSSAPKECRVFGWLHSKGSAERHFLAEFVYDLEKSSVQNFKLAAMGRTGIIDTIRLDFISNHGNPTHTCLYRLRVHGHRPDSSSLLALQS